MLGTAVQGAADPASAPELHTFTNAAGKTIQAQIMGVTDDSVTLKRDDGQTFKAAIKIFSDADQAYITHWVSMNAIKHTTPIFQFELTKTPEVQSPKRNFPAGMQGYVVKVTNTTSLPIQKPIMEYIIYAIPNINVPGGDLSGNFGRFAPDEIAANGTSSFETPKFTWAAGLGSQALGKLMGLWVRVYDADHQLIQEWCSPPELMGMEKWTYVERGQRGAGGGANATSPPADSGAPASTGGTAAN